MRFWGGLFLLGTGLNILVGWHGWGAVFAGHLSDPDSYMRLERIRQGVAEGHLVNRVARDDSGAGVLVEWSKLLDLLLWVMAAPLAPFLGWTRALFCAGIASGPLAVGALGVALAFAARPLTEDRLLWAAVAAAALLPGLARFADPGVVHYHMLLVALIAASAGCVLRAARGSGGLGFLAGAAGGFAIWLTPETMPFILLGYAALLFAWMRPGQRRLGVVLLLCGAGFVDVLGFGYAIDPPAGGYLAPEIDRLSGVYFTLGLLLLVGGQILRRLPPFESERTRALAGLAVALALLALWIGLFPKVAEGPYGLMSAEDRRRFFGVIQVTRPLAGIGDFVAYLLPGVLALAYALWRCAAARGAWPWLFVAFCILLALALAQQFLLFAEFPVAAAAALLPVAMSEAGRRWRPKPALAMVARIGVLAAVLLPPQLPALAAYQPAAPGPSCDLRHIDGLLGGDRNVVVLAEAEDTPELLYRTPVETVGSLYQHGVPGYLRNRAAWRATPGVSEPAAVTATGARLVLFCHDTGRYAPVADLPGGTLWDALQQNQPPPWLTLRNADPKTGWRVYAVTP